MNKLKWLKFIKTYESFNKEIPNELKDLFSKIRKIIGYPKSSFKLDIDLNDLGFVDIIVELDVIFNRLSSGIRYEDKDIIYYSNVNINDIIIGKERIQMPIRIDDIELSVDKLCSVISHEIRHIYDVYTINDESDMKSFINSIYYAKLISLEKNIQFSDFLKLVYLSLEHELVARNTMIWEVFINCKCSKEVLYKLYQETFMYKSFEILKSFNSDSIINEPNILEKVNNFINYFGGELCDDESDLTNFFNNWDIYFKNKAEEYVKEGYLVLDDLLKLNEFRYSKIKTKNVKELLLYIHEKYIM